MGFPGGSDGKESACNVGDLGSNPGLGRFPQRRKWQPTPVFLPGEFHVQRSLAGYSPWGLKESDMTEKLTLWVSQVALVIKNPFPNAGDIRDRGLIPGLGRILGKGNGNPLWYSCLENPMVWGAWWYVVHMFTKSPTWLKWLHTIMPSTSWNCCKN